MKPQSEFQSIPFRTLALLSALLFLLAPVVPVLAESRPVSKSDRQKNQPASDESAYPQLVIGPGDLLSIFVYGESGVVSGGGGNMGTLDQLPTDYQVDSDGKVLFPFLGPVSLAGLTPIEAGEKIARMLSKPRKVTVLVKQSSSFWVSVLGNVAHPGRFQIAGRPTLLSALSEAGGPLPDSDLGGAVLIHDKEKSRLDLNQYLSGSSGKVADPYLYPGDVLVVKRSGWPTTGEWAVIASIVASAAVVTVEISNLKK